MKRDDLFQGDDLPTARPVIAMKTRNSVLYTDSVPMLCQHIDAIVQGVLDTGLPEHIELRSIRPEEMPAMPTGSVNPLPLVEVVARVKGAKVKKETVPAGKLARAGKIRKALPAAAPAKKKANPPASPFTKGGKKTGTSKATAGVGGGSDMGETTQIVLEAVLAGVDTRKAIVAKTGIKAKTVSRALNYLSDRKLVHRLGATAGMHVYPAGDESSAGDTKPPKPETKAGSGETKKGHTPVRIKCPARSFPILPQECYYEEANATCRSCTVRPGK